MAGNEDPALFEQDDSDEEVIYEGDPGWESAWNDGGEIIEEEDASADFSEQVRPRVQDIVNRNLGRADIEAGLAEEQPGHVTQMAPTDIEGRTDVEFNEAGEELVTVPDYAAGLSAGAGGANAFTPPVQATTGEAERLQTGLQAGGLGMMDAITFGHEDEIIQMLRSEGVSEAEVYDRLEQLRQLPEWGAGAAAGSLVPGAGVLKATKLPGMAAKALPRARAATMPATRLAGGADTVMDMKIPAAVRRKFPDASPDELRQLLDPQRGAATVPGRAWDKAATAVDKSPAGAAARGPSWDERLLKMTEYVPPSARQVGEQAGGGVLAGGAMGAARAHGEGDDMLEGAAGGMALGALPGGLSGLGSAGKRGRTGAKALLGRYHKQQDIPWMGRKIGQGLIDMPGRAAEITGRIGSPTSRALAAGGLPGAMAPPTPMGVINDLLGIEDDGRHYPEGDPGMTEVNADDIMSVPFQQYEEEFEAADPGGPTSYQIRSASDDDLRTEGFAPSDPLYVAEAIYADPSSPILQSSRMELQKALESGQDMKVQQAAFRLAYTDPAFRQEWQETLEELEPGGRGDGPVPAMR